MSNIESVQQGLMEIDGALGCAIVDYTTGMLLGSAGAGVDLELAAAGNSEVVKAKLKTMESLGIKGGIEDILITLDDQLHIIRPSLTNEGLFLYLVLDKKQSNLAIASDNSACFMQTSSLNRSYKCAAHPRLNKAPLTLQSVVMLVARWRIICGMTNM
jgi:hypothetical protein